jgi:hypothetical protein
LLVRTYRCAFRLFPSPPPKASDPRALTWQGGGSVELDAIDPNTLRNLVRAFIEAHVDPRQLEILRAAEESERELLRARPGQRTSTISFPGAPTPT